MFRQAYLILIKKTDKKFLIWCAEVTGRMWGINMISIGLPSLWRPKRENFFVYKPKFPHTKFYKTIQNLQLLLMVIFEIFYVYNILLLIKFKWTLIRWEYSFERLSLPTVLLKSFGISGGKKPIMFKLFQWARLEIQM